MSTAEEAGLRISSNLIIRPSLKNENNSINNDRRISQMDSTSTEDIRFLENEIKEGLRRSDE